MNESTQSERPGGAPAGQGFFTWLRGLGIVRGTDRWFAGVAGGVAAKAGIDPLIVRGIFVVLALLGGPGLVLYLVGWLLLPDFTGRIHVEDIVRGRASAGVLTAAIVFAALVIVPAVFGFALPGIPTLGAPGPWGWGLWSAIGVPDWLPRTLAWLFWIAVLVVGFLWLRRVMLQRGREQAAQRGEAGDAAGAAAGSGSGSARPAPSGASFAADAGGTRTEPLGAPAPGGDRTSGDGTGTGTGTTAGTGAGTGTTADTGARSFAERADEFARRTADEAASWGEKAGRWGEEVGRQADEWSARYAEHHDAHRMGAAQVVLTLALALLAGGAAALWVLELDGVTAAGAAPAPLIAAIIAALAVFALSLIVAGVRGRHTGWVGFLSACGVFALLVTVVLPWGTRFLPFGTAHIDGMSPAGTVVVAGSVEVDLTGLDEHPGDGGDIEVWQLAGNTTVHLPEHRPTAVRVRVLAGNVRETSTGRDGFRVSGPFLAHDTGTALTGTDDAFADDSVAHVTVYLLAGNVRVEGGGSSAEQLGESWRQRHQEEELRRAASEQRSRADLERLRDAQTELEHVEWRLEEPGLDSPERRDLERQRDELRETVDELEQEMAR